MDSTGERGVVHCIGYETSSSIDVKIDAKNDSLVAVAILLAGHL